jgi:predicted nucleotide-binding protein
VVSDGEAQGSQVVAVIYGRDLKAKEAIERLLRSLGLAPLSFDQALLRTAGLPTTMGAVRKLFTGVKAVIVVFTPDDLAVTHPHLSAAGVGRADSHYSGQPRQNVLIETGMAIAALPAKTIMVRIGAIRQASDLEGLTVVDMGSRGSAQKIARLLVQRGCDIPETIIADADIPEIDDLMALAELREDEPTYSQRGVSIFEAARCVGLRDIEHRMKGEKHLPPSMFYARAQSELAISAVTAASTFDQFDADLRALLKRDVAVKVLVVNPDTPDMSRISARERKDLAGEVRDVYEAIKRGGFADYSTFELRLAPFMYPFSAVMVDGDIAHPPSGLPEELDPSDSFAHTSEIRVQPGGYYTSQHQGPVLQFSLTEEVGPFHHFASDMRRQWAHSLPFDVVSLGEILE